MAKDNKGGWNVCKIEMGTTGHLVPIAQMDGNCAASPGVPEISCKATVFDLSGTS